MKYIFNMSTRMYVGPVTLSIHKFLGHPRCDIPSLDRVDFTL